MTNDFAMRPAPEMCGEDTINQLIDAGLLPDPREKPGDHPWAKRLFVQFKAGGNTLTKIDAYAIGNELNRQAARIRELENGGRAYSAKSPDVGLPPSADVGREPDGDVP